VDPQHFFSELKRRNVIRVAGFYLVGACLLMKVTGMEPRVFDSGNIR